MKRFPFERQGELEALAYRLNDELHGRFDYRKPLDCAIEIVELMESIGLDYDAPIDAIYAACVAAWSGEGAGTASIDFSGIHYYPPTREVL